MRVYVRKVRLVLGRCSLAAMIATGTAVAQIDSWVAPMPQQTVVPIDNFPASSAAVYQMWMSYLTVRSQVETPASAESIYVAPVTGAYPSDSGPHTIYITPTINGSAQFPGNISWVSWMHETVLANDLPIATWNMVEQTEYVASALEDWMAMAVDKANPGLFSQSPSQATCAGQFASFANRRAAVFGGAGTIAAPQYYWNSVFDNAGCALYALFVNKTGMNFIPLTNAMNATPPTDTTELFALFDALVPEFEGVPPSTWFDKNDPVAFGGMPDGTYLGVAEEGLTWFGNSLAGDYGSGINPLGLTPTLIQWATDTEGNSIPTPINNQQVCWSMKNAWGVEVIPPQLGGVNQDGVYFDITGSQGAFWYNQYPTGSYLVPVAASPTDLTTCSADPRQNVAWIVTIVDTNLVSTPKPGDLVVSIDGPRQGQLPLPGTFQLEVVAPTSGAALTFLADDLAIIQGIPQRPDGSFEEVTLKMTYADGTVIIRTFQPDWAQPIKRLMVDNNEPTLLVLSREARGRGGLIPAGTLASAPPAVPPMITPGEELSLFGKNFTGNAPWVWDRTGSAPVDGCFGTALNNQGTTSVLFTVTDGPNVGQQFKGGILDCTTKQIDALVPGLPLGATVSIQVVQNGTASFQAITAAVESPRPPTRGGAPR